MYALPGCCESVILILLCMCNIICLIQTRSKALCLYILTLYNEKCQISLLQIVVLSENLYVYILLWSQKLASIFVCNFDVCCTITASLMDIFLLMYMSGWSTLSCLFIKFWERHLLLVHYRLFQWCVYIQVEEC